MQVVWNEIGRTFIKPLRTSFTSIKPASGIYGQMELIYSSDCRDHYMMCSTEAVWKKLKPELNPLGIVVDICKLRYPYPVYLYYDYTSPYKT